MPFGLNWNTVRNYIAPVFVTTAGVSFLASVTYKCIGYGETLAAHSATLMHLSAADAHLNSRIDADETRMSAGDQLLKKYGLRLDKHDTKLADYKLALEELQGKAKTHASRIDLDKLAAAVKKDQEGTNTRINNAQRIGTQNTDSLAKLLESVNQARADVVKVKSKYEGITADVAALNKILEGYKNTSEKNYSATARSIEQIRADLAEIQRRNNELNEKLKTGGVKFEPLSTPSGVSSQPEVRVSEAYSSVWALYELQLKDAHTPEQVDAANIFLEALIDTQSGAQFTPAAMLERETARTAAEQAAQKRKQELGVSR